jgi:hypothetical protein
VSAIKQPYTDCLTNKNNLKSSDLHTQGHTKTIINIRTHTMKQRQWLLLATLGCWWMTTSEAAPASPEPQIYQQPDDSDTPELYLHGDERYAWLSDAKGYTVLRDNSGWYVYAQKTETGDLESAGARVGRVNPKKLGLDPNLIHDHAFEEDEEEVQRRHLRGRPEVSLCQHEATVMNPCYLKQMALLVRFNDHGSRNLPAPEDIDILFIHNGPTGSSTASSGSIANIHWANSFDTFVLDTRVSPWQHISKTEAYAAQGNNGFNFAETRECWAEALQMYAGSLTEHGLEQFDGDNDGFIDGMAIVHSGVAAESNGNDCETGAAFNNRIWSHAVPQAPKFEFLSESNIDLGGIKVGRFYVFSGIFGKCPPDGIGGQWHTG